MWVRREGLVMPQKEVGNMGLPLTEIRTTTGIK